MLRSFFITLFLGFFVLKCADFTPRQDHARFVQSTNGSLVWPASIDATMTDGFTFAAFGDSHYGLDADATANIRRMFTSIQSNANLKFVLGMGDLVNWGTISEYNEWLAVTREFTLPPFYAVVGNHDIIFEGWNNFKNLYGPSVYTFVVNGVFFVVMDSASSTICHEQLQWLESQLASHVNDVVVIAMHIPIRAGTIGDFFQLDDPEETYQFMEIARRYNVDLVLSGHYHGFKDETLYGVRYVTSGGANNRLDDGGIHYITVTINGTAIEVTQVPF